MGIGAEGTHGTAVSRTNWLPFLQSAKGSRNLRHKPVKALRSSSTEVSTPLAFVTEREEASGSFAFQATYENSGMFLLRALGNSATTGPSGADYTHTYTLGIIESSTLELRRGTLFSGSATTSEVFEGVKFGRTRWRVSSGGILVQEHDWVGETAASRGSAGSPTYGSGQTPVQARHAGNLSFNAVNYGTIYDLSIDLDHGLIDRLHLGSLLPAEPAQGECMVSGKVTLDYEADTLYTAHVAGTQSDLAITFTSGALTWTFTLQNAYIDSVEESVGGQDLVRQVVSFRGLGDGTDHGLKIVVVNTASSASANGV